MSAEIKKLLHICPPLLSANRSIWLFFKSASMNVSAQQADHQERSSLETVIKFFSFKYVSYIPQTQGYATNCRSILLSALKLQLSFYLVDIHVVFFI